MALPQRYNIDFGQYNPVKETLGDLLLVFREMYEVIENWDVMEANAVKQEAIMRDCGAMEFNPRPGESISMLRKLQSDLVGPRHMDRLQIKELAGRWESCLDKLLGFYQGRENRPGGFANAQEAASLFDFLWLPGSGVPRPEESPLHRLLDVACEIRNQQVEFDRHGDWSCSGKTIRELLYAIHTDIAADIPKAKKEVTR